MLLADFECLKCRITADFVHHAVSVRPTAKLLQMYSILCHAYIIPEQSASKSVQIFQQMAKLCRKLKWLGFLHFDFDLKIQQKFL